MIIYKCDLCKEICENENMTTIQVPTNKYVYAMNHRGVKIIKFKSSVELSNIEICPTCAMRIADFLDSHGITS